VPFTAFTKNFSSIPLIAPPPFGSEIEGISMALDLVFSPSVRWNREDGFSLFFIPHPFRVNNTVLIELRLQMISAD